MKSEAGAGSLSVVSNSRGRELRGEPGLDGVVLLGTGSERLCRQLPCSLLQPGGGDCLKIHDIRALSTWA